MKYLGVKAKQKIAGQSFPVYLIFLVLFAAYMVGMYMSFQGEDGLYHVNIALRKNLMEDEMFKQIDTHDEFYAWLRAAAKNFWVTKGEYDRAVERGSASRLNNMRTLLVGINRTRTGNGLFAERQNYPLHFMLLRQKRVEMQPCGSQSKQAAPLQKELWQHINSSCIDGLSESGREVDDLRNRSRPFPRLHHTTPPVPYTNVTTDPFVTDGKKEPSALPPMRGSRGRKHTHTGDDKLYSAKLPYQELFLGDVEGIVSDLKANDWIDFTTRVVAVETLVYNAVQQKYVVLRYVVEFLHSGRVVVFSTSEPFWLMFLDGGWHTCAFVFDVASCFYGVFSVSELLRKAYVAGVLGTINMVRVRFWAIWDLVHLGSLIFLAGSLWCRFGLWRSLPPNMSGTDFYTGMMLYQDEFAAAKDWSTWAFLVTLLRFYEYVQEIKQLHTRVTQTIRLAAWDIIVICFLASLVTVGFAIVANVMYGWYMAEFNTITHAAGWLWRLAVTGELGFYYEMRDVDPAATPVFIAMYLTITWLILLNVVLGILAAGFEAASESANTMKEPPCPLTYQDGLDYIRSLHERSDPLIMQEEILGLKVPKKGTWDGDVAANIMKNAKTLVQSFSDVEERKQEEKQAEERKQVEEAALKQVHEKLIHDLKGEIQELKEEVKVSLQVTLKDLMQDRCQCRLTTIDL